MGSKSSKSDKAAARTADSQSRLAEELFAQSGPIREQLFGRSLDFLNDPTAIGNDPRFGAAKTSLENQFGQARQRTIESTAPGGALIEALAGLEGQKALGLADVQSNIFSGELDRATNLAMGGTTQAQQGLGSAGSIQSQQAAAHADQKGQKGRAVGTVIGAGIGSLGGPAGTAAGAAAGGQVGATVAGG